MSMYVTYQEFINSPYGQDYTPGPDEFFETSGQVEQFLTHISGIVDLYCQRTFDVARREQIFQGDGDKVIFLDAIPVTGIISITYQDIFGTASGVIAPGTYALIKSTGKILFPSALSDQYLFTVTYDAGFTTIPDPIKQATLMLANTSLQAIENGAVAFAEGGANVQFRFSKFQEQYADPRHKNPTYNEGIPVTVEAILRRYRYLRHA